MTNENNVSSNGILKSTTGEAFVSHLKSRLRPRKVLNIRHIARRINRPYDELLGVFKELEASKLGEIEKKKKPRLFAFSTPMSNVVALAEGRPFDVLGAVPNNKGGIAKVRTIIRRKSKPIDGYTGTVNADSGRLIITKGALRIDAAMPHNANEAESLALLLKAV